MAYTHKISVVDSHTGGEPTRTIFSGFPELAGKSMAERKNDFENHFDHLRRALILEPRGSEVLVGALLCTPQNSQAVTGVIFFNNDGYLGMCGHGTIGVIKTLQFLGRIHPGTHIIETPVGEVSCVLHENGEVSVHNVASYRYKHQVSVEVDGLGKIYGDIAWGGNWFFLVDGHGLEITPANVETLTDVAWRIRLSLESKGIFGENGHIIDHIELFSHDTDANSRSFVLCPGKAYDRSPCGTGTSAKLACLAADGVLAPNEEWIQESVIGSRFTAFYQPGKDGEIMPVIKGNAHIHAVAELLFDETDPFCYGIITS